MKHETTTRKIISCAYKVYNTLGFGFLESVYKKAMLIELNKNNVKAEPEKALKVYYDNQVVGEFYVGLLVENEIIVELKSVESLTKTHACPVKCLPRLPRAVFATSLGWNTLHYEIFILFDRGVAYSTGAFVILFNWGSSTGELLKRDEKGNRIIAQLWSKRCRR